MNSSVSSSKPLLASALLRCRRTDDHASPLFESVRPDLGLWVWELRPNAGIAWDQEIDVICGQLKANFPLLVALKNGSEDYTLHLSILIRKFTTIRIPPGLAAISAEAGFAIEICPEIPT